MKIKINLATKTEYSVAPAATASTMKAMATLVAPSLPDLDARGAVEVMAVIDKSGSMSGAKLALVKQALLFAASQLRDGDVMGVVTFGHDVDTPLPPTTMTAEGRAKAEKKISSIEASGMTNLSGGLLTGIAGLVEAASASNAAGKAVAKRAVLLFTDGHANRGITSVDGIRDATAAAFAPLASTSSIYTFGFGSDHNDELLRSLADMGEGLYTFISQPDDIPAAFADCLGGLLSVVAQNVQVRVAPAGGTQLESVLSTKYRVTKEGDGGNDAASIIHISDLYSEEQKDIVFSLILPPLSRGVEAFVAANVSVSAFNVLDGATDTVTSDIVVARPEGDIDTASLVADVSVTRQVGRLMSALALEEARSAGERGDLTEGIRSVDKARQFLVDSGLVNDPASKEVMADLCEARNGLQDSSAFDGYGKYAMTSAMSSHTRQRGSRGKKANEGYSNTYQRMMQEKSSKFGF